MFNIKDLPPIERGPNDSLPRMTDKQRRFLTGLARAQPQWDLLQCPHAAELPALRWKLVNLQSFRQHKPADFEKQADMLEAHMR